MRRENRKINAIAQAQMILHMLPGDLTCAELAEETGLHYTTVLTYCRELHRAGAAHIARWDPDPRGRHIVKVYRIGKNKDARRPQRMTSAERQARARAKRAALRSPLLMMGATA